MHRLAIMLLVLLLPVQSVGAAQCKVNGKWYPYTHPNCKSNTKSTKSTKSNTKYTSEFVLFKIQNGVFSPCIPTASLDDISDLDFALQMSSTVTGLSDCRAFSDDGYVSALCKGETDANVLFAPNMQSCEKIRSDYRKAWGVK